MVIEVFGSAVKIFIRLFQGIWEKEDKVSGDTYLVDTEVVKEDLEDVASEPHQESDNGNN